jgi:hypothetical protein
MGGAIQHRVGGRSGFLILALLALWMQVLVPTGFMVSTSGGNPALVICTGHGALDLSNHGHPDKAPQSKTAPPCVFAGHGLASAAPEPQQIAKPAYVFAAPTAIAAYQVSPGQGLAAPPPPARGPPLA